MLHDGDDKIDGYMLLINNMKWNIL
jgi:hypothetical protein